MEGFFVFESAPVDPKQLHTDGRLDSLFAVTLSRCPKQDSLAIRPQEWCSLFEERRVDARVGKPQLASTLARIEA